MTVRTSATSGLWNASDADTWGLGLNNYPHPTNDDAIIADTTTVTLSGGSSCKSLEVKSGGAFDGDGNVMEIAGVNSSNFAIDIDGDIDGTDTDFDIRSSSTAKIDLAAANGKVRNLIIQDASCVATMYSDVSLLGNLTITLGELTTGDGGYGYSNLEVLGTTTIGDGSASATEATLTCNNSDVSLGSGVTTGYAVIIEVGGFFDGGTGTHTMGSFKIGADNALAKATLTTGVTNINGKSNDSNKAFRIAGSSATFSHPTNGTILMNYSGASSIQTSTKSLYKLTLNHANCDVTLVDALTVANNLTITAGELDTSSSDYALTVTGQVSVTGTLTCNESAIDIGSLYITSNGVVNATNQTTTINKETTVSAAGFAVYNEGTFHHNNGLVVIGTDTNTIVYGMEGDDTSGANSNAFYRVQVELDNAAYFCKFRPQAGTVAVKIANDLTVAEGIVSQETATHSFEVDVDVSIEAGGVLGRTDITGANTFGSLTIASSGEYIATSGTTTFTSHTGNYSLVNDGTFTHNNGTVKVDYTIAPTNNHSRLKVNELCNLEVEMNRTSDYVYLQKVSGDTITILGDLHMIKGDFEDHTNSDKYVIHGLTTIESTAKFGANTSWHTGDITHHGLVVLNGGTYYRSDAGGTVKMGGIRNIGGSVL
jgi:hypothetical protein